MRQTVAPHMVRMADLDTRRFSVAGTSVERRYGRNNGRSLIIRMAGTRISAAWLSESFPIEVSAGPPCYVWNTPLLQAVFYRGPHGPVGGLRYPPRSGGVERRYISDNGRAPTARTAGPWKRDLTIRPLAIGAGSTLRFWRDPRTRRPVAARMVRREGLGS